MGWAPDLGAWHPGSLFRSAQGADSHQDVSNRSPEIT